jgi:alpha/beta superfamily hydrolase
MHTQNITFENASGHQLAALLDMPAEGEPVAYVLFAHCFTCSKDYKGVVRISKALAAQGFGVLRFDFTGLGESEGDFAETTFSSNVEDLISAADFMSRELEAPKVLVGHSLGGAAVIHAALRIPSVVAVATLAAPANLNVLAGRLRSQGGDIESSGEAEVKIGGRSIRIGKDLVEGLEEVNMRDAVARMDRALLICHSPEDRTVDIDSAIDIFSAARHPKSFLSVDNADHLFSNAEDGRYVGSMIATWARRAIRPG